jgi:hypothetical protein
MASLETVTKANAISAVLYKFGMSPKIEFTEKKAIIYLTRNDAISLLNNLKQATKNKDKESDLEFKATEFYIEIGIRKLWKPILVLIGTGYILGKII